jgi:hypothetical protein
MSSTDVLRLTPDRHASPAITDDAWPVALVSTVIVRGQHRIRDALLAPTGRKKQQQVAAKLWLWAGGYRTRAKHPAR